jgi:hypothetical protein
MIMDQLKSILKNGEIESASKLGGVGGFMFTLRRGSRFYSCRLEATLDNGKMAPRIKFSMDGIEIWRVTIVERERQEEIANIFHDICMIAFEHQEKTREEKRADVLGVLAEMAAGVGGSDA